MITLFNDPTRWRGLWTEARVECRRDLRMPDTLMATLAFPAFFYAVFALMFDFGGDDFDGATYLLATLGAVGVIAPAMMGCATVLANERRSGWLELRQALPLPAGGWLTAKLVSSVMLALLALLPLILLATVFGGVRLTATAWTGLVVTLLAGLVPFSLLGLAIGRYGTERGAGALANLIFLPLIFFSGLMMPVALFPEPIQQLAAWLPAYHLGELALHQVGVREGPIRGHWLALAFWGGLAAAIALAPVWWTSLADAWHRGQRGSRAGG